MSLLIIAHPVKLSDLQATIMIHNPQSWSMWLLWRSQAWARKMVCACMFTLQCSQSFLQYRNQIIILDIKCDSRTMTLAICEDIFSIYFSFFILFSTENNCFSKLVFFKIRSKITNLNNDHQSSPVVKKLCTLTNSYEI